MITMRKLATSAVATLGLFAFGAVNSANAGHPASGREIGHGPVVNSSGKIGKESGKFDKNKFDKERKEWEHRYWNRDTYRYDYCLPACSYPVETCAPVCKVPVVPQPVCEVPVCREPVFVPTTCYEYPCSYDFCKPYEFRKPCYDDVASRAAAGWQQADDRVVAPKHGKPWQHGQPQHGQPHVERPGTEVIEAIEDRPKSLKPSNQTLAAGRSRVLVFSCLPWGKSPKLVLRSQALPHEGHRSMSMAA